MRILLVALLVAGCYRDSTPSATPPANKAHPSEQVTSDVLAFIPKESEIVIGADLARLRSSPLWGNQIEPAITSNGSETLTKVRTTCGFDPLNAIAHFVFGTRKSDRENETTLVVRGIEPHGAIDCAEKLVKGNATSTRDGDTLVLSGLGDETTQAALSPLGRSAVLGVVGPGANRSLATSRVQSGTPLRTSAAFMELYTRLEPNASAWFIVNGASPVMQVATSMGINPRFIDGSVTVTDRYVAVVRVTFATPAEAQNLVTTANSVSAQVRAMVETFDIHADGSVARFDIVLTSTQAQTVLGMLGMAI